MEDLLIALRAAAEPTRLRLLALAGEGAFCTNEMVTILGQSQPRLTRHLRLLTEAGLLLRLPDGAHTWFALPDAATPRGELARALLRRIPADEPVCAADRRAAAAILSDRARLASDSFRRLGEDWDEMQALGLPATAVETALTGLLGANRLPSLLDIGTGTGRLLEVVAPHVVAAVGIDINPRMVAFTRGRLARLGLGQCSVRQADMYRLPFPDGDRAHGFDAAILQMVLHHAEDPLAVLREAARALRPGGRLFVIDLAEHTQRAVTDRLGHRHPGFYQEVIERQMQSLGFSLGRTLSLPGPLTTRIWHGSLAHVDLRDPAPATASESARP